MNDRKRCGLGLLTLGEIFESEPSNSNGLLRHASPRAESSFESFGLNPFTRGLLNNALMDASRPNDEERKRAAWQKATPIPEVDTNVYRYDDEVRVIKWSEYGQNSVFGWHIDHIVPQAVGGPDVLSNLRARHRITNTSAGGRLGNALRERGLGLRR